MSKKRNASQRRQQLERKARQRRRYFVLGEATRAVEPRKMGYDVPMIAGFLDQLLLELRAHLTETLSAVRVLEAGGGQRAAMDAIGQSRRAVAEQLRPFWKRYQSALVATPIIETRNVTEAEIEEATLKVFREVLEKREEQVGHLESLKSLFAEAYECAECLPGDHPMGVPLQPLDLYRARDIIDGRDPRCP